MRSYARHLSFVVGSLLLAACSGEPLEDSGTVEEVESIQSKLDPGPSELLFFASDVHLADPSSSTPISNLQSTITWAKQQESSCCEFAALVGDHATDYNTSQAASRLSTINQTLLNGGVSTKNSPLLTQGNHDSIGGLVFGEGAAPLSDNQNYQVYAIAWDSLLNGNYGNINSNPLRTYFEANDFRIARNKVQVILIHYPLHTTSANLSSSLSSTQKQRIVTGADNVFHMLQEFGAHLDIVALWGHDHRHATCDQGINLQTQPGQSMHQYMVDPLTSCANDHATQQLNFAYVNAGYITPRASGLDPSATLLKVDRESVWIIRWYAEGYGYGVGYDRHRRVALKSYLSGFYTCADSHNNRGWHLYADNRSAIGAWETFHLEDLGDGQVALWAHATGKYVRAANGGTSRAVADSDSIGSSGEEVFDLWDLGWLQPGRVDFRSHTNYQHLRYDSFLPANVNSGAGSWFIMEDAP